MIQPMTPNGLQTVIIINTSMAVMSLQHYKEVTFFRSLLFYFYAHPETTVPPLYFSILFLYIMIYISYESRFLFKTVSIYFEQSR